jgi:sphinganine C4-monooxygenase
VKFHSRHHRLYVPYAFGALYNHPFEGFLLDTAGTVLAFLLSRMTSRQSMWFFTLSTIKTVDDHCGYAFPWDPLQHITGNNSAYHDIHHQSWGIKNNFSQPFFTFWDHLLGTQWKGEVSLRYERSRTAAQKQVDLHNAKSSDARLVSASALGPASLESETFESNKVPKVVEEKPARKAINQGTQPKPRTRSTPAEGLDMVGHLVTGSIRQK